MNEYYTVNVYSFVQKLRFQCYSLLVKRYEKLLMTLISNGINGIKTS